MESDFSLYVPTIYFTIFLIACEELRSSCGEGIRPWRRGVVGLWHGRTVWRRGGVGLWHGRTVWRRVEFGHDDMVDSLILRHHFRTTAPPLSIFRKVFYPFSPFTFPHHRVVPFFS